MFLRRRRQKTERSNCPHFDDNILGVHFASPTPANNFLGDAHLYPLFRSTTPPPRHQSDGGTPQYVTVQTARTKEQLQAVHDFRQSRQGYRYRRTNSSSREQGERVEFCKSPWMYLHDDEWYNKTSRYLTFSNLSRRSGPSLA